MFSNEIIGSDVFLDMPLSTQALYFHLGMNADDDWFVNPKRIMRMIWCWDDELKLLIIKWFLITFEDNVIVITHRKRNNIIKWDRYHKSLYQEHLKFLKLENWIYKNTSNTIVNINGTNLVPELVHTMEPEPNLTKPNLTKPNIESETSSPYFSNSKVNEVFIEFLEMRKKIKATPTPRAVELLIKNINWLWNDFIKIQCIEHSIVNNWKDIYPPKEEKKQYKTDNQIRYEQKRQQATPPDSFIQY